MKFRAFIFLIIVCGSACRHAALKEDPSQMRKIIDTLGIDYNNLTEQDRSKYVLTAEVTGEGDESCNDSTTHYYKISTILQNRSNDTLKYLDWTCSHMIWYTDSKLVWADERPPGCIICSGTFVSEFDIPPHKSRRFKLLGEYHREAKPATTQFRIGMILQRVAKPADWKIYFKRFVAGDSMNLSYQTQNLIWSNVIQVRN